MATGNARTVDVNGISYRWPRQAGGRGVHRRRRPRLSAPVPGRRRDPQHRAVHAAGLRAIADGTVPSFTCPNNMSIITGTPAVAARHLRQLLPRHRDRRGGGDDRPGAAARRHDPRPVRRRRRQGRLDHRQGQAAQAAGQESRSRPAATSASPPSARTSARCAENGIENVLELVGMPLPDMYSMELSLFVLEAGDQAARARAAATSCTCRSPTTSSTSTRRRRAEARRFYQELDARFGRLAALGAVVALTADHGMNDKSDAAGKPNVIWLQDILDAKFGKGDTAGDLPDHRRVRRAPRRARRLRARLVPRQGDAAGRSSRPSAASTASSRCWTRRPRAACTICRPTARPTWWSSPRPTSASARPRRTTTCRGLAGPPPAHPRRRVGGEGAVHPEPRR